MANEELRATRVATGVSHRQRAAVVNLLLAAGLTLDGVARPAGSIADGAAALDHEVRDDAVEGESVIERLARDLLAALGIDPGLRPGHESGEILHSAGRVVFEQLGDDLALGGFEVNLLHRVISPFSVFGSVIVFRLVSDRRERFASNPGGETSPVRV